jgi:hypothetical protein
MMNVRLLWTMIDFYQEHGPKTALGKEALRLIPISQRYCFRSDKYRYHKLMRYRREVEATRHSALKAWIRITTKAPASEPAEGEQNSKSRNEAKVSVLPYFSLDATPRARPAEDQPRPHKAECRSRC